MGRSTNQYVYILTRRTYKWDFNQWMVMEDDVFLSAFSSSKGALHHCIGECDMEIVEASGKPYGSNEYSITFKPTRVLDKHYMPYCFKLDDDYYRDEFKLTKYTMQ